MQRRVATLTASFLNAGDGDKKFTAQIFANFASQRVVKPFVPLPKPSLAEPQQRFGDNVLKTLSAAKKASSKPGSAADKMRRQLISAGACDKKIGAINPVWHFVKCLYMLQ